MNPLLQMLSGGNAAGMDGMSIVMQAVGAALRGESPQAFLKRLANQHPALKKIDFNDLAGSAQTLAKENNADIDELKAKAETLVSQMANK